ncbi:MAG: M3 family metallopeptidase [Bacteroidaceae bacterium]|jgi:peptidyl-dipeptidase Dcp
MNQENLPNNSAAAKNPFFASWQTPHNTVPFDRIQISDFAPAIEEGIRRHKEELRQITQNPDKPTFENTVVALEKSGRLLDKAYTVLENLLSAESTDALQQTAEELTPLITDHFNDIFLDPELFGRIKAVHDEEQLHPTLTGESRKLLEDTYDGFVRHGAGLTPEKQETYRQLTRELSLLSLQYGQNILKETAAYKLHLTAESDVEGMPENIRSAAAQEARQEGLEGWVFTLQAPSYMPFMKYCKKRELRREMYIAYNTRCTRPNGYCNFPAVARIVELKRELANLAGFADYADYVLCRRMAENKENVYQLLNDLLNAYRPTAVKEVKAVEQVAQELDGIAESDFRSWDFAYYSNILKERDYQLNDELLRPYFKLENVIEGVFGLATRLYGIHFAPNREIPVYHPDVIAYEVTDRDGSFLGVLYTDFFPRPGKRPGAWMTEYKGQWHEADGTDSRPHVSLVMNFTKPTAEKPALLTLGEVETFLHEFGHSLHGLFASTTYPSLSGTNVYWDFVELPSQFMENFAIRKEFLSTFARHYQSGEILPDALIDKIVRARNFNVAYACLRQLSFGFLDMAWYTLQKPFASGTESPEELAEAVRAFEQKAMESTRLLPADDTGGCMSVQFSHIFAGGYSAGYYSYKWAEVLDADAFALFLEKGIFDQATAESFRRNILARGGTEHPMVLYKRFRGQEPTIDALLRRNGIIAPEA